MNTKSESCDLPMGVRLKKAASSLILLLLIIGMPVLAHAKIFYLDAEEMIRTADVVAIVAVDSIRPATEDSMDLIVGGTITERLKGGAVGVIEFKFPRFFPCAAFDVSTGSHLVFLRKNGDGTFTAFNWDASCIYLNREKVKWLGPAEITPVQLLEFVQEVLKAQNASEGPPRKSSTPQR